MEEYNWEGKLSNNFIYSFTLTIGDEYDRFNGEGVLQEVTIMMKYDSIEEELYQTHFGREEAIRTWSVPNNPICTQLEGEQITEFKNWLITCLTPKTEQRKVKIGRIQKKMTYVAI